MVLPDLKDNGNVTHHLAVGAGKDSNMYIVDRDNMGKFTSNDTGIYQELSGALAGGVWSAPAYFNNTVYYGSSGQPFDWRSRSRTPSSPRRLPHRAATHSAIREQRPAFPLTEPRMELCGRWKREALARYGLSTRQISIRSSTTAARPVHAITFSDNSNDKFVTPMIANGKVYVGTPDAVVVFGLLP